MISDSVTPKLRGRTPAVVKGNVFTSRDVELIEEQWVRAARRSFWAYRQFMRPNMKRGWFQRRVAHRLQQFYEDLIAGRKPKLIIVAPPQHGKSDTIQDFIAWLSGKHPDFKTIFASFSIRLGVRTNLRLQRQMETEKYQRVFADTRLGSVGSGYVRNQELLEFVGQEGSFRNTTVMGSITGEGLDLGVIDDPIKGRAEANSRSNRDKVWEWFTDDFNTRFSENAGFLMILTRWHIDDPAGRMLEEDPSVDVMKFSAIAEEDEFDLDGTLRRRRGEALFPEHKSLTFLLARKKVMSQSSWYSIYQGSPIVVGGEMFPTEKFVVVPTMPRGAKVEKIVRYWDKAGTENSGKWTAGVLMARLTDGRFIIMDCRRGQWNYHNREQQIKQSAEDDGHSVSIYVEQEPGSGGKESAERTVAMLAGYKAYSDKVTGDKETRADPYAGQVQGGNVMLLNGPWVKKFLEEHEFFPNGPYKDQVDAAGGAFAQLTTGNEKKAGMLW